VIGADYARTMARYNRWINERLYECCARLPEAGRRRDMGAFFKSIHGTLNHLLLGDRGQLTTLLMQQGIDPGVTDLMWMPQAEAVPS